MTPAQPGRGPEDYDGTTYYGRSPLKEAPFENSVVGGYIFLAGLSGAAQVIATAADLIRPGRLAGLVRSGRYLSLLAPVLGAPLLIYDLHTPQRFYNMLRIFRRTSPMSIGTWLLMGFTACAGLTAGLEFLSGRSGARRGWARAARVTQLPAALTGAGLATYTASLLSATSTPLWAAAPRAMAVRLGSSSMASGAGALALGEHLAGRREVAADLDTLAVAALAAELVATVASRRRYAERGISAASHSAQGIVEMVTAELGGIGVPLALKVVSGLGGRSGPLLGALGSLAILGGSLALRIGIMAAGDESARRPEDGFRFAKGQSARGTVVINSNHP